MANKRNSRSGSRSSPSQRMTKAEQEQKTKKAQRQKTARTVAIALLIVLLLAILGFAGFGIAYLVTDGFGGKVATAVIMIDDEVYSESTDGLTIYPGEEVRVQRLTGDAEYTMKIEGNASENNFAFTLGAEPYTWRDMDGEDMTAGFTIAKTGTGFTIDYESLPSIITTARGVEAVIEDVNLDGDLFTLVITVSEREYRFGFGIGLPVSEIMLDSDQIIISGDGVVSPDEPSEPEEPDEPDEPDEPNDPDEPGTSELLSDNAKAFIRELVLASQTNDFQAAVRCWEAASSHSKVLTEQDMQHPDIVKASQCFSILMLAITDDYIYDETERESLQDALGDLVERYN